MNMLTRVARASARRSPPWSSRSSWSPPAFAVAGWLLFAQTLVFAVGALAGLRYAPYGLIFRHLVRPRLGPPSKTEPEAPPRFSQGVGMVFAGIGTIGFAAGLPVLGIVFAAFALAAAFLNAAFDFCLGCQMYLFIQRIRPAQ